MEICEHYSDIPEILYNAATGEPHTHCPLCDRFLLDEGIQYIIEKAISQNDILMDFAICLECYQKGIGELYSIESRKNFENYFDNRVDFNLRQKTFTEKFQNKFDKWTEYCLCTAKPIRDCKEYQLAAQCEGRQVLYHYMPFAISDEGIIELENLLSKKTKEDLRDFMNQINPQPSLEKSPDNSRTPVLV
ncbi:MAG: hypothetical protein ABUK01_14165 [Leptospirales bacterium]